MTPRLSRTAFTVIAVLMLVFAPAAFAVDEQGDAGEVLPTAQDLGDAGHTVVWGALTGGADVDLYRVCLTDGASFSASTVGTTMLDTQLFLFDSGGFGVYANDDAGGTHGSRLPANHRFSPQAGGEHYLAIGSYNRDPQSVQGEIFLDNFSRFVYPDGVVPANGFGSAEPLVDWAGRAAGGAGAYRIELTGTRACVPPDTTPPGVDLRSPEDGARVARGSDLVADFSCSDEGGSGLESCVGSVADGEPIGTGALGDVAVTVTARDGAGNETVVTHTVTVVDESAPSIEIAAPADGAVYARHAAVQADYGCADEPGGSGLVSCLGSVADGAAIDTSTLGEHELTVEATDAAGNASRRTVRYTVVDVTAPSVELTAPGDGAVYPLGEQVPASYACVDEPGGSGVVSCVGTVPAGTPLDTTGVGSRSFTVTATDAAGNTDSRTVSYSVADATAPEIAIAAPVDGAVYAPGEDVRADYSCEDQPGGAGVASCEGSVPVGARIDTSRTGTHTFEVHATDGAGNSATRTVTYGVAYDFRGFLWPLENPPKLNRWKAGIPVPVRFSLDGYRGKRPEAPGYPRSARCDGGDAEPARAAGHRSTFRYDRRRDVYSMLWRTERRWSGSCRELVLKLDDGSVHTAKFQFVKR